jgi:16S rRNA (uracil1498-N3)-methyltransferase
MNRFFLTKDLINNDEVHFPADVTHQILRVLRLKSDDIVHVLDNQGFIYRVILQIDAEKGRVLGTVVERTPVKTEPGVFITLYFGLTTREKTELILQKGTEIGVSAFTPVVSTRTLVQSDELTAKRRTRWESIIREAAEQSHRGRLPVLNAPQHYEVAIADAKEQHELVLIAWEGADPEQESLQKILDQAELTKIALFVGPEGGFSEEEIALARAKGCQVVSLGKRILRMETAAILLPSSVLFALGEM